MRYVLETERLTKDFPGVRALDNISVNVKKGEILGLIGENGAGKSTLLKILNGWYPKGSYKGIIKINGVEQNFFSPHDSILKGIGFVPQEINVMNELTVAENIFVGHLQEKSTKSKILSISDIILKTENFFKTIKINLNANSKVRILSIGQKQLLMVARALSWNPEVLILDEPTTSLALDDVEKLFETIEKLKEKGTSIIFVTHKLEELMGLTDRVTILRDGHCISTYSKEEYDEVKIINDMVGRKISNMYPKRKTKVGGEFFRVDDLTVEDHDIKNKNILENISFSLKKGEILGLAGLVGSGRSEVLNSIFGRYKMKKGKMFLEGKEILIKNEKDAIKKGFSLVTEDRKNNGLLMLMNIKRNISINSLDIISRSGFIKRRIENKIADKYMKIMKIKAPDSNAMVASLSGGNQQKVVMAKSLNRNPKILLFDEPTKGIDIGSKNEIYNLINSLIELGISIIMVSSELPELLAMCDRLIIISQGKIAGELSKDEATQENVMIKCCK